MNPLVWTLLTPDAITKSGSGTFSGRVTDIRTSGSVVVVATEDGGVWTIQKKAPVGSSGFQTRALSDEWDDPDVSCLANGPDGHNQVYAGCSRTLAYFELADDGSITTQTNLELPAPFAGVTINRVVVDADPSRRRIVLATDAGVCWSAIPANPASAAGYSWSAATGLTGSRVGGLCAAKDGAVHAALWGSGAPGSTDFGIFKGTFSTAGLVFTRSAVPTDQMTRVSLASCASNPEAAFAVFSKPPDSNGDSSFGAVLKYDASSDSWSSTTIAQPSTSPGEQGGFNNCIAVAPDDPSIVAFGWQSGTFVLRNGQWSLLASTKAHSDLHGLWFTKKKNGKHTLYAGGDGGLLEVEGPTETSPTFDDRLNAFLPTLLFKNRFPTQGGYATFDVSHSVDGLIAGGLQDNGVVFLATLASSFASFEHLLGGDGGTNVFLTNGVLIARESNTKSKFQGFRWNAGTGSFGPSIALPADIDLDITDDHRMNVCARVVAPAFHNSKGELLHAISAAVPKHSAKGPFVVLGLFGDGSLHGPHWAVLGKNFDRVTAVGSMNGQRVFLGTQKKNMPGEIIALDAATGAPTGLALPATLETGYVIQFEVVSESLVFALYAGTKSGHLLVLDGASWKEIPLPLSEPVYSMAVDWSTTSVYLTTDTAVYRGMQVPYGSKPHPIGFDTWFEWMIDSAGLPARPHGAHLRIGMDRGVSYLYLATNGRSVYRAPLTSTATAPGAGEKSGVSILFGVVQDGGGVEFDPGTGKIIIVPPRQEVQAVLADLLASERLRDIPSKEAAAERRAALERVAAFLEAELAEKRSGR